MYWSLCSLVIQFEDSSEKIFGSFLKQRPISKGNRRSCPSAAAAEWGSCSILTYLSTQVSNVFPTWMVWIGKNLRETLRKNERERGIGSALSA